MEQRSISKIYNTSIRDIRLLYHPQLGENTSKKVIHFRAQRPLTSPRLNPQPAPISSSPSCHQGDIGFNQLYVPFTAYCRNFTYYSSPFPLRDFQNFTHTLVVNLSLLLCFYLAPLQCLSLADPQTFKSNTSKYSCTWTYYIGDGVKSSIARTLNSGTPIYRCM